MVAGMGGRGVGIAAVVASAGSFGAMAIFARWADQAGVDLVAVLFLRFALASAVMLAVLFARRQRLPTGHNLWVLVLMGGVGYVSQSGAYFAALQHASAGLVALLLYLYPTLVTVLEALRRRRHPGRARLIAVLVALAGTALILGGERQGDALGIALGAGSALIYAVYILAGEGVMAREEPFAAATVVMLAAALVFGLLAAATRPAFPHSLPGWGAVVAIALLSTVVAMGCFFVGVQRLGAPDAATLSTLEPVVTCVLAAALLGEEMGWRQLIGGGVILATVVFLSRQGARPARSA